MARLVFGGQQLFCLRTNPQEHAFVSLFFFCVSYNTIELYTWMPGMCWFVSVGYHQAQTAMMKYKQISSMPSSQ